MAQLTDDCFAFDGPLISTEEATARLEARVSPQAAVETVPLDRALGRILAEDVAAGLDVPPYDNSAVDGFALYADDLAEQGETELPVAGRVAAGHPLGRPQARGEAMRIFTGAPMPDGPDGAPGPDTVMMLEDARLSEDGARVILPAGLTRGSNSRAAGEDVAAGTVVLRAGIRLRPQEVGMLAALGLAEAPVRKRLTVALFSTGDEVREPGAPLPAGKLYDSNRFTIAAALRAMGCDVEDLGILADDAAVIRKTMRAAAARCDAVLASGGMSMGEEDHVRDAIAALGRLAFWRIAIKPGRPVGMGLIEDGAGGRTPFVGLPGNPVAALTTFIAIARPLLLRLGGARAAPPRRYPVRLGFAYKKKSGRREFVRVTLDPPADDANGAGGALPTARKHGKGGAGMLSSLVGADGFVELSEDRTHIAEGETAHFLPFTEVLS